MFCLIAAASGKKRMQMFSTLLRTFLPKIYFCMFFIGCTYIKKVFIVNPTVQTCILTMVHTYETVFEITLLNCFEHSVSRENPLEKKHLRKF
jgi:hypothetical protein